MLYLLEIIYFVQLGHWLTFMAPVWVENHPNHSECLDEVWLPECNWLVQWWHVSRPGPVTHVTTIDSSTIALINYYYLCKTHLLSKYLYWKSHVINQLYRKRSNFLIVKHGSCSSLLKSLNSTPKVSIQKLKEQRWRYNHSSPTTTTHPIISASNSLLK